MILKHQYSLSLNMVCPVLVGQVLESQDRDLGGFEIFKSGSWQSMQE